MLNSSWLWGVVFSLTVSIAMAQPVAGEDRAAEPFSAESLRLAADYLKDRNGHAMLVYYRDNLVFEEYFNGWSADKPHRLASGTKSFSGAMLAAAVQDGLLKLDEKVVETISEWKDDSRKSQITIRHLLSLTSGIFGGSTREPSPSYARAVMVAGAKFWPGQRFQYGPIPYQVFGELMRRKLADKNESVEAYLRRRILDPIGLQPSRWVKDEDGNIHLPNGAIMTAREWAKFGLLIRHQGKWQDRQVVPAKVLQECFVGTGANPYYGITFWLGSVGRPPKDLIMAKGRETQRLYIVAALELVVVQFAETDQFNEGQFLKRLLVE
ncbi:MAG: serine hydrolase [Deltaproteobacteria bacterium]|nr:serine hydrolase [Deltaproteobacteria bacterium]